MQCKSYLVQSLSSTIQVIGYDSRTVLAKVKTMGLKGPFIIRERGLALLVEVEGKVVERGELTEQILSENFPGQSKEWTRRTLESFNQ